MFTFQEQRQRVMLHMSDSGSRCRRPDGPSSDDPTRGVEGSAFLHEPTEASETLLPNGAGSKTCNVLGMAQWQSHLNDTTLNLCSLY